MPLCLFPTKLRTKRAGPSPKLAFTLIELLVVIAIIGVLMAILLPTLGHARQTAKLTVCTSNIRGQGQVVLMYAGDHKECLPPRAINWNQAQPDGSFKQSIWFITRLLALYEGNPFLNEDEHFSPSGHYRCTNIRKNDEMDYTNHFTFLHTSANQWLYNIANVDDETGDKDFYADSLGGWQSLANVWRRVDMIKDPTEVLMLHDAMSFYFMSEDHRHGRETTGRAWQIVPGTPIDNVGAHHVLRRLPAVFVDGHASALPVGKEYWDDQHYMYSGSEGGAPLDLSHMEALRLIWFTPRP